MRARARLWFVHIHSISGPKTRSNGSDDNMWFHLKLLYVCMYVCIEVLFVYGQWRVKKRTSYWVDIDSVVCSCCNVSQQDNTLCLSSGVNRYLLLFCPAPTEKMHVSLAEALEVRGGPLQEEEVWAVLSQSADSLQELFHKGMRAWRDIWAKIFPICRRNKNHPCCDSVLFLKSTPFKVTSIYFHLCRNLYELQLWRFTTFGPTFCYCSFHSVMSFSKLFLVSSCWRSSFLIFLFFFFWLTSTLRCPWNNKRDKEAEFQSYK